MINNIERKILYQIAGDIIVNRYEKYEVIPEKYRDIYKTYIKHKYAYLLWGLIYISFLK
jgi:hypothetical protein